ncbi:MAG: YfbR-like 5'-deoxynucleotidase [Angelakisella sp.]
MGNSEFSTAYTSTLLSLQEMNLPEVDIFLESFLPAYSLTLDEL